MCFDITYVQTATNVTAIFDYTKVSDKKLKSFIWIQIILSSEKLLADTRRNFKENAKIWRPASALFFLRTPKKVLVMSS